MMVFVGLKVSLSIVYGECREEGRLDSIKVGLARRESGGEMQARTSPGSRTAVVAVGPIRCRLERDYVKFWIVPVVSGPSRLADLRPPITPDDVFGKSSIGQRQLPSDFTPT